LVTRLAHGYRAEDAQKHSEKYERSHNHEPRDEKEKVLRAEPAVGRLESQRQDGPPTAGSERTQGEEEVQRDEEPAEDTTTEQTEESPNRGRDQDCFHASDGLPIFGRLTFDCFFIGRGSALVLPPVRDLVRAEMDETEWRPRGGYKDEEHPSSAAPMCRPGRLACDHAHCSPDHSPQLRPDNT
jgi:hypothetical protein